MAMGQRNRTRTPEEIQRDKAIRDRFQAERPTLSDLVASGECAPPVPQGGYLALMRLFACIKQIREQQQLSLSEVAQKTGIDKAQLSRLENGQVDNPTYQTLERLAVALGKRLEIQLHDDCATAAN
ncbi:MAG: helix-turn-helix transcriptional regulator [Singulisphaera sp.]